MRVCMVGTSSVLLNRGAGLAENGYDIWCVDADLEEVSKLQSGVIPIYEPGLVEIVRGIVAQARLCLTKALEEAVKSSIFPVILARRIRVDLDNRRVTWWSAWQKSSRVSVFQLRGEGLEAFSRWLREVGLLA